MSEKLFEKDCDENVCSFDYSTLDTHYEYKPSKIIEWNKHSDNAEYTDLERITEILNIKQMRLESLMKHREEIGKLFDRIDEQQAEIERLKEQLSLVCKAESSSPYNSVKEVLRRQIFGLDCAAEESANAWNHYYVLSKLFEEQYGEHWDNFD